MERITYRITLDAHRNGIQRTLQGFETADKMARRIAINLVAGSDTFDLPMTNVVAMMYVTTPSAKEPSIDECVIDGNTIIYDVQPITEEGITEMQMKVIETSPEGAKTVIVSPKIVVEVTKSGTNDESAKQTTTFTALEDAIAKADAVYNSRILQVVIEQDCTFKVYYADGTVYENDYFREAMYNGNALLSQSYAVGGAGVREEEETDNSKYYSNVSRSASENARIVHEQSVEALNEIQKYSNYTYFNTNFETGELGYISTYCEFNINKETGQLENNKNEAYTPEEVILSNAEGVVNKVIAEYDNRVSENELQISNLKGDLTFTEVKNHQRFIEVNASIEGVESDVKSVKQNSMKTVVFDTYIDLFQSIGYETKFLVGQTIYIRADNYPDLWVSDYSEEYAYVHYYSDQAMAVKIAEDGYIEIGNYTFRIVESKTQNLSPYAKKTELESLRSEIAENVKILTGMSYIKVANGIGRFTLQYPEGFNYANCLVVCAMAHVSPLYPDAIARDSEISEVELNANSIAVTTKSGTANSENLTLTYRLMLYKSDITLE